MYFRPMQNQLKRTILIDDRPIEVVPNFKDTDIDWNGRDPKRNVAIILQDGIRTIDRLFHTLYKLANPPYFDNEEDIEIPFTCSQFDNFKDVLRKDYKLGDFESERTVQLIVDNLVVSSYDACRENDSGISMERFKRLHDIYGDEIPIEWEVLEPFIRNKIELSIEKCSGIWRESREYCYFKTVHKIPTRSIPDNIKNRKI